MLHDWPELFKQHKTKTAVARAIHVSRPTLYSYLKMDNYTPPKHLRVNSGDGRRYSKSGRIVIPKIKLPNITQLIKKVEQKLAVDPENTRLTYLLDRAKSREKAILIDAITILEELVNEQTGT